MPGTALRVLHILSHLVALRINLCEVGIMITSFLHMKKWRFREVEVPKVIYK